jgi:hypothetical protein
VFDAISSQMSAINPMFTESGLIDKQTGRKVPGIFIGRCGLAGNGISYEYDEYQLYQSRIINNLNGIVLGEINYRKSSFIKTYIKRGWPLGYNNLVIDPKGEYDELAAEVPGSKILRFGSDASLHLNVLDEHIPSNLQLRLIETMAVIAMPGVDSLNTRQRSLLRIAIKEAKRLASEAEDGARVAVLPDVVDLLFEPTSEMVAAMRLGIEGDNTTGYESGRNVLKEIGYDMAFALDDDDLMQPFRQPTTPGLFDATPLLVLNCKDIPEEAKVILITLFNFFATSLWGTGDEKKRFHRIFLDESWDLAAFDIYVESVRRLFKLGRTMGIAVWVVAHHLSNLERSGNNRAVLDLVNDADTVVLFRQKWNEINDSYEKLGINERVAAMTTTLNPGQAVWRIGKDYIIPVKHILWKSERAMVETSHLLHGESRLLSHD